MEKVEISYDEENPLNGVFHYLDSKYPDSVEISVSSAANYSLPESLINHEITGDYWESDSQKPYPWFQIKFKNMKLDVIGYVLRSTYHTSGASYPNSWILAGSNDEENWVTLDEIFDRSYLVDANTPVPFECAEKESDESFNIFRFQMTEPTRDSNWIFRISRIELFGDLYINKSQ